MHVAIYAVATVGHNDAAGVADVAYDRRVDDVLSRARGGLARAGTAGRLSPGPLVTPAARFPGRAVRGARFTAIRSATSLICPFTANQSATICASAVLPVVPQQLQWHQEYDLVMLTGMCRYCFITMDRLWSSRFNGTDVGVSRSPSIYTFSVSGPTMKPSVVNCASNCSQSRTYRRLRI